MDRAPALNRVRTSVLEIAYEESAPAHGAPVLLMHGFPYDPRTYDGVVPRLVEAGCRVIVPYLRGYGPTRFLASDTLRSGQQAALGNDLKELMDVLTLERAVLAGYDWGGRRLRCRRALAGTRARFGLGQRLQHSRHRRIGQTGDGRAGAPPLVSILLSHCARPCGTGGQPARDRSTIVAPVVAELAVRRVGHRLAPKIGDNCY
jgi:fermentation-respiration switch protein FrsA (DUF1100 family)